MKEYSGSSFREILEQFQQEYVWVPINHDEIEVSSGKRIFRFTINGFVMEECGVETMLGEMNNEECFHLITLLVEFQKQINEIREDGK